jgi:hypothetical protein
MIRALAVIACLVLGACDDEDEKKTGAATIVEITLSDGRTIKGDDLKVETVAAVLALGALMLLICGRAPMIETRSR